MSQDQGLRMTRTRRVILESLREREDHPTAEEVFASVREQIPRVSLGTVYRNLKLMADAGLIQRLERAGSQARFDGRSEDHLHLCCRRCGRVDDVPGDLVRRPEYPSTIAGHRVLGYDVQLISLCPRCQDRPSIERREREDSE